MKLSALATVFFGANAVFGARLTQQRRERNAERLAKRSGSVRLPATNSEGLEISGPESYNETSHVEYSSNWAGAVLIGTGYKSVTGTFVVPTPSVPSGGSTRTEVSSTLASTFAQISALRVVHLVKNFADVEDSMPLPHG